MTSPSLRSRLTTALRLLTPARTAASLLGVGLLLGGQAAQAQQGGWVVPSYPPARSAAALSQPVPPKAQPRQAPPAGPQMPVYYQPSDNAAAPQTQAGRVPAPGLQWAGFQQPGNQRPP